MVNATKKASAGNGVVGSLAERAMLVDLTISTWRATVSDREVNKHVAQQYAMDESMGDYAKRLVGREALAEIHAAAGVIGKIHARYTLPWNDKGFRILSSEAYFQYMEDMSKAIEDFNSALERFISAYPDIREDAKRRLGKRAKDEEWPEESELRRRFGVSIKVLPLPVASDFRVKLGDTAVDSIREQLESGMKSALEGAMKSAWTRLYQCVTHLVDRLNQFDPEHRGKNPFRDTVITNIRDLLEVLPALNITNDENLTKAAEYIGEKLAKYEPEVIRDDDKVRRSVIKDAEKIVKRLEAYI